MTRKLPPVWLIGSLGNLPIGILGAVMLVTLPQLLASMHVPEPQIATITAIGLAPTFFNFLLAPLLDWRFNRRTYAIVFLLLGAVFQFAMLESLGNLGLLTVLLFGESLSVCLSRAALGGWLGAIVPQDQKGQLGTWYAVVNIGGTGIVIIIAIILLRDLPFALGAGLLSLMLLPSLVLCFLLPVVPADGRLARDSFLQFFRDLAGLLRQREILWTLMLFATPSASFALSNMLGGLGRDFGASERLVSIIGGTGATIAGVAGSLLVPLLLRLVRPRPLYLLIGGIGACFTLALIGMRPNPVIFALAMLGENLFQSAAFAVEYTINLRSIGPNNPFAATQFALVRASSSFPIAYMQVFDGQAYGRGGISRALLADGGLTLAACCLLALLFRLRQRPN